MIRRLLAPFAAAFGVLVLLAAPASAHVKIDPSSATQGSYTVLTFRVPNEMDDADTVGLKVQMPTDHPIASVSVQPKDGWTISTKTAKPAKPLTDDDGTVDQVVTEVDWTGGSIAPGQFDTFSISIGPLPDDTDELVFPTIQQYKAADGTTSEVDWIQTQTPGGAEPEHPAPSVQLVSATTGTTAAPSDGSSQQSATTVPTVTAAPTSTSSNSDSKSLAAIILGAIAIVLALVAIGLHFAHRRGPETAEFTPSSDDAGSGTGDDTTD